MRIFAPALFLPVLLALLAGPAAAQEDPAPQLAAAARQMALAHVLTGDPEVDETAGDGLDGLSLALTLRTTVEPGPPVGIDLDRDDLSLLTFLYWPVTPDQPAPSPAAYVRLNRFLQSGGMILFDTRDGDIASAGVPGAQSDLQRLAAPLDIPPLEPVPDDHVLTRSFYLIDDFPGRWQGNPLWAEASAAGPDGPPAAGFRALNDGVSPVLIGANDWAEAWAIDDRGLATHQIGRGLDGERQRELALRFGINLVMYVLTGNYKSDQVHVPALLDRLGRNEPDPFATTYPEPFFGDRP